MKSFLTWITAVAIGGLIGYGASFLMEVGLALPIGIGVLIGSSVGITINIHRDDDLDIPPEVESAANTNSETKETT
ncbi:hypothetical protein [Gracilimonas sediminicola]|uniref:Uncharacterized protein n=1 Tax=Gracilimonas sediminicola TaxID=2952158 RepID=A0A9X2L1E0_9BACT|nr:hypothetical protein [Gracilimonas sediminicola]MCP9290449.1 hypothetical protein [Gracilimonas sediminicola]